eukprot:8836380-Alexandrium_andersonii.AAC.1
MVMMGGRGDKDAHRGGDNGVEEDGGDTADDAAGYVADSRADKHANGHAGYAENDAEFGVTAS